MTLLDRILCESRAARGLTEAKISSIRVVRKRKRAYGHPQAQQHGHEIWIFPAFDELPRRGSQVHVILHELGHWFREWRVELSDIMGFEVGEGFFGVYGMPDSEEGFAEAFAAYFTDPSHLKKHWPDAFKKIQAYVKKGNMMREFRLFANTTVDKLRSEPAQR